MQALLKTVTDKLKASGAKVSCAESCTGGLLAGALSSLPGSSAWFDMGWVTYSNEAKHRLLGVSHDDLMRYGAVSEAVVLAMAEGARLRAGADFALSISGIAGPTGGTAQKPVGSVWIALESAEFTSAELFCFSGDRTAIRDAAVYHALLLLNQALD